MNSNYTFNYSVSTTEWDRNKDEKNTRKLKWREKRGAIKDLINDIKNHHAFCACFNHEGESFGMGKKEQNNLKSTHFIVYDFDAVRLTAREFYTLMETTEIPPSLVYTTLNNGKFKVNKDGVRDKYNNRYRVVYLLDTPIYNAELYKETHRALKEEISLTIDDKNIYNDKSDSGDASHMYGGNRYAEVYSGESVLSLAWLRDRYDIKATNEPNKLNEGGRGRYIISPQDDTNKHGNYIQYLFNQKINKLNEGGRDRQIIKKEEEHYMSMATTLDNSEFVRDYYDLSVNEIIEKYISVYPSIEVTQVEYNEDDPYYLVPNDYIEIKRKWHFEEVEKSNGDTYKVTQIERCKNGQGRRRRLFLNLIIRRLIEPSLSLEHLLVNALYELKHFIDNNDQDDIITKKDIATIAVNAYFEDIEKWRKLSDYHKPKYKVNKGWCVAHGISPRKQAIKVRGELNKQAKEKKWLEVDHYYNPSLTNNGNIELLKANGIEIGLTALKEYKKSRGYTKSKSKDKQTTANEPNRAIESDGKCAIEQQPTTTANEPHRATESDGKCAMAQQNTTTTSEPNRAIESDDNKAMEQQPTTTINGSHSASNEVTNGDAMTMEIVEAIVNELDPYYSDGAEIKEVKPHRYEVNLGNAILYPELANKVYNYLYEHGLNAGNLYMDRENDGKCCNTFTMWLG